jgi:hypothetical protein
VLSTNIEGTPPSRITVVSHPRNWGGREVLEDVTMTSEYEMLPGALGITFSMDYAGKYAQPLRTQEVRRAGLRGGGGLWAGRGVRRGRGKASWERRAPPRQRACLKPHHLRPQTTPHAPSPQTSATARCPRSSPTAG